MSSLSGSIVFGNDITYANGTYILKDTYTLTDSSNWSTEYSTIGSKYHYTCFTSSDTCEKINYIHHIDSSDSYYFELSGGKNHLDVLKEMLNNSANENNSEIKNTIDTWYQNNMIDYTSQLEDTVFCNDRSYNISDSAWDKDHSNIDNYLRFGAYTRIVVNKQPTLICLNNNDKFTVNDNNGNGALKYPVGLLTADEIAYAGGVYGITNNSFYLYNNLASWGLSSYDFYYSNATDFNLFGSGYMDAYGASGSTGVRPSISIKQGTVITGGSGTATDPYIVG